MRPDPQPPCAHPSTRRRPRPTSPSLITGCAIASGRRWSATPSSALAATKLYEDPDRQPMLPPLLLLLRVHGPDVEPLLSEAVHNADWFCARCLPALRREHLAQPVAGA